MRDGGRERFNRLLLGRGLTAGSGGPTRPGRFDYPLLRGRTPRSGFAGYLYRGARTSLGETQLTGGKIVETGNPRHGETSALGNPVDKRKTQKQKDIVEVSRPEYCEVVLVTSEEDE